MEFLRSPLGLRLMPGIRLVLAAVTVIVAGIAIYLFAVLNVYIIAWVVQLLQMI